MRSHRPSRRAPKPVFVDRSGRRHRIVVASGAVVAVLVLFALTTLVAGLFGARPIPLPGLPDLGGTATTVPATEQTQPASEPVVTGPVSTAAAPEPTGSAEPTSPRHVPTQTPTRDHGRPSRT